MARGDVVSVNLPPPPGGTGREQTGFRPALAVQADSIGEDLPTLMIIPFTSQLSALRFPLTMRIEPSRMNGLTQTSVLLVFQLRAVDRARIGHKLGTLEKKHLDILDNLTRQMLGL